VFKGMASFKRVVQGYYEGRVATSDGLWTYTKSLVTQTYDSLYSTSSGKAELYKVIVISQKPLKTKNEFQFCINVGCHRAIDVDASEELFAVVQEASASQQSRQVLLYRRPAARKVTVDAVATYQPPSPVFQPSDICFYRLGGHEVLLVSDEANDAIHVVRVEENCMRFVRYLTNDCRLVKQPSAMAVDVQGRLWVACQGGKIITIQPRQ
jgi:hypothetical protein